MGPYKPLRTWVDEFPIPYYMESSWEFRSTQNGTSHLSITELFGVQKFQLSVTVLCPLAHPNFAIHVPGVPAVGGEAFF